ncbi:MAG: hypothetical protein FJ297_11040 [Planctomycetes bacterium]|nr:hypothetical protein [Planctomycetota bacterium]
MDSHDSRNRFVRGVVVGWIAHACGIAVTFFTTPIVVLELGDVAYGVWSVVISLTGYYALFDLGLGKAASKYVAQFHGQEDVDSIRRVVATTQVAYLQLSLVLAIATIFAAWCVPHIFSVDVVRDHEIRWVVLLVGLRMASMLLSSPYRAAMEGYQRFDISTAIAIGSQTCSAALVVVVLRLGGRIVHLGVSACVIGVLTDLILWQVAVHLLGLPRFRLSDSDSKTRNTMLGFGALTVLANCARGMGQKTSMIVAAALAGPTVVAHFAIADSIVDKVLRLGKPIAQATMPSCSRLRARSRDAEICRLVEIAMRVLTAMGLSFSVTLWLFGREFVGHWIVPEFASHCAPSIFLLATSLIATLPGNAAIEVMQGVGHARLSAICGVAEAALMILLSALMVASLGSVGLGIAVLIPIALIRGVVLPIVMCMAIGMSLRRYVTNVVGAALCASAPGVIIGLSMKACIATPNLVVVMCVIGINVGVSCLIVAYVGLPKSAWVALMATVVRRRKGAALRKNGEYVSS